LWPTLIATILVEAFAWRVGETASPDAIARWQSEKPERIWRGHDSRSYLTYKLAGVRLLKPEVLVLGESRAALFNGDDLRPYTFYNAGFIAWTFSQYLHFLRLIGSDGYEPRVLIFNLEYWMFSSNFDRHYASRFYTTPLTHADEIKSVIDELWPRKWMLMRRPSAVVDLLSAADERKGIAAVLRGDGFRADGSLAVRGGLSADPKRLADDRIAIGKLPVQLDDGFAKDEVASFERFVAFAQAKKISLIGIQMPLYEKILDGLNSDPRAGIWREFRSEARRQYFDREAVLAFDFADMAEYRNKPQHFFDSVHPDAVIAHAVLQRVLADPRVKALLPKAAAN
jgi:hypothetical protein